MCRLLQEYEMQIIEGQCCGRCVKTKCKFNGAMYAVGETWKSADDCVMFECIQEVSTWVNFICVSIICLDLVLS